MLDFGPNINNYLDEIIRNYITNAVWAADASLVGNGSIFPEPCQSLSKMFHCSFVIRKI